MRIVNVDSTIAIAELARRFGVSAQTIWNDWARLVESGQLAPRPKVARKVDPDELLRLLAEGKSKSDCARKFEVTPQAITYVINNLIEEGRLPPEANASHLENEGKK